MLRNILATFVIASLLSFCGEKNKNDQEEIPEKSDIISSEEMIVVLEDIYLAEGAVSRKTIAGQDPEYYARHYFRYVLKSHNITSDQFMDSYTYYSSDADKMLKILEVIINDLSQKQGMLKSSESANEKTSVEKAE